MEELVYNWYYFLTDEELANEGTRYWSFLFFISFLVGGFLSINYTIENKSLRSFPFLEIHPRSAIMSALFTLGVRKLMPTLQE